MTGNEGVPSMIGRTLAHYRIVEKLGQGGMGEVYRAHDEKLDRDIALKVLLASALTDETARARLLREARSAAALNHPHICTVHEVGEADGQTYIAMEFVEGKPLSEFVRGQGLPVETALRYGSQIADGLGHAHERGVVHRDLKSANVVITSEGRAKVLDFGLAKRLEGRALSEVTTQSQGLLTQPGAVMGTLPYMAPEQLRGEPADARSDVWALGVVLHEMLVGERPFRGQTGYELSSAILNQPPPALPARVPVELRAVIERCLAKEPGRRYHQGGEVRAALEAVQAGTAVVPWAVWGRKLARRRFLALAGALAALVVVLVGLNVGGLRDRLLGGVASGQITSIAVLPLENLMGDSEQDYFVAGMHEALITELSKIGALTVISRTSAMRYRNTDKSVPEIARELGVDAVVEGSVLRAGETVRVTAQLIDGRTDRNLWADNFDRELTNILALHSDVARAIAREIKVAVTPAEAARLASARPVNPEAYAAYLKGRFHWHKLTPEDLETAMKYFQLALEKDPNYALAYTGISVVWAVRGHTGLVPPREAWPKAKAAALKAIELDDTLAEAHAELASHRFYVEWDWSAAGRELQRAIELNPNYPEVHVWYSEFLIYFAGRWEEGMAEMERALELDPHNSFFQSLFGARFLVRRRYDDAIAQYQKVLRTDPNFPFAHRGLWAAFELKRMYEEALAEARRFFALRGDSEVAEALERGYTQGGYAGAMRLAAEKLAARSKLTYVQPTRIARLYLSAGEKDRALDWLEKAYQERNSHLVYINVVPGWDPLRDDPRFQDLLRRLNFPE